MVGLFFAWAEDGEMINLYSSDGTAQGRRLSTPVKQNKCSIAGRETAVEYFLSKNRWVAMLFYGFFSFIKIVTI